ncbi:MAG: S8 family serine peptidase [Acidobacteriota bacterium]
MNRPTLLLAALALCAIVTSPLAAERYVVVFEQENLKAREAQQIIDNHGATMVRNHADIGVAVVEADDSAFASKVQSDGKIVGAYRDVQHATAAGSEPIPATLPADLASARGAQASLSDLITSPPPLTPSTVTVDQLLNTFFFAIQWDLQLIEVEGVWTEFGNLGDEDVEIAVLASGLDYTHPDLQGRVDLDRSRNFVPEDAAQVQALFPGAHPIADLGFQGTWTASLMVCNALVFSCPVPHSTLIGVKWLDSQERGRVGDLVTSIRYAASIGSDVIVIPENLAEPLRWSDRDDRPAIIALKRAIFYAWLRGSAVLTGAGGTLLECGIDADADGDNIIAPAQLGATAVAATGINDQYGNFTDFGRSLVDIAAPGGGVLADTCLPDPDPNLYNVALGACTSFSQWVSPLGVDFSTLCNFETGPTWIFALGADQALAHAGSVAALIDSKWNGWLPGWLVNWQMTRTADDVIDPGFDVFSGRGRVNAYRAVTE